MDSYDTTPTDGGTIAAIFSDRDSAHEALTELHHAGYRNVWVGVTRHDTLAGGEATMENAGGGFMESLSRFFSGEESTGHSLHDALLGHGVSTDLVRQTESTIAPGNAVVTVHGENDPEEAISIIEQFGGRLVGGKSAYRSTTGTSLGTAGVAGLGAVGATTMGYEKTDTTLAGTSAPLDDRTKLDETRRLQLREERLSIDKQRVSAGEARIGKEVVSEQQSIDVPVFREELYIERRPVTGTSATASMAPIGKDEEIVIPLTREQVDVQKRTVVTEEVAVGKRRVEETEHVSDTVRREELRVDDRTGVTGTGAGTKASALDEPAGYADTTAYSDAAKRGL